MIADRVYRELRPAGKLAGTVACLWTHAFGGDRHTFRVVPDGCVDLIAAAGYADQPHLSREVAELAGVPLRTLLGD